MTPAERLREVGEILAAGLLRLQARELAVGSKTSRSEVAESCAGECRAAAGAAVASAVRRRRKRVQSGSTFA